MRSRQRVTPWTIALLTVGAFALGGCSGSAKPPLAADAWITGFAETCGIQSSPVELDVIATHGTREVDAEWVQIHGTNGTAHDLTTANATNRWRPTYRLNVSPGVYRLTSFDGGIDAPLFVATRLVTVGAKGEIQDLPTSCK
jgi:hypothetical protein